MRLGGRLPILPASLGAHSRALPSSQNWVRSVCTTMQLPSIASAPSRFLAASAALLPLPSQDPFQLIRHAVTQVL